MGALQILQKINPMFKLYGYWFELLQEYYEKDFKFSFVYAPIGKSRRVSEQPHYLLDWSLMMPFQK